MEDFTREANRKPTETEKYEQTIKLLDDTLTKIWNGYTDDISNLEEILKIFNSLKEQETRLLRNNLVPSIGSYLYFKLNDLLHADQLNDKLKKIPEMQKL